MPQNLYAYLYPVCYVDLGGGEAMPAHKDGYHNNTCIQGLDGGTCKDRDALFARSLLMAVVAAAVVVMVVVVVVVWGPKG